MQINKHGISHVLNEGKYHMIMSIDAEKAFDEISIYDKKNFKQSRNRGIVPQHNKGHM